MDWIPGSRGSLRGSCAAADSLDPWGLLRGQTWFSCLGKNRCISPSSTNTYSWSLARLEYPHCPPGSVRTSLAWAMSMNFFSAFFFSSGSWKLSGCHCWASFLYALIISFFWADLGRWGGHSQFNTHTHTHTLTLRHTSVGLSLVELPTSWPPGSYSSLFSWTVLEVAGLSPGLL